MKKWAIAICVLLLILVAGHFIHLSLSNEAEYQSIYANEISDFMQPFSGVVEKYASENAGTIPSSVAIPRIFESADLQNDFLKSAKGHDCVVFWNTSVKNVSESKAKVVVAWMVCKNRSRFTAVLTCDELGKFSATIVPQTEVRNLKGKKAIEK